MEEGKLTLATLCGGAVQELTDRAMKKVAENILDPNTDPTAARSITIKIKFKPDKDDKEDVHVSADVQAGLAPELGVGAQMYMSRDIKTGAVSVVEHQRGEIRGQISFDDLAQAVPVRRAAPPPAPAPEDDAEELQPPTGTTGVIDMRRAAR